MLLGGLPCFREMSINVLSASVSYSLGGELVYVSVSGGYFVLQDSYLLCSGSSIAGYVMTHASF